ncbi:MAG: hypothetical protein NWQ31_06360 [Polaribacter sp.]|nr:hypothetical protein [Polaribacter sp.]
MIIYTKRKDLDVVKYDACIKNSIQFRIYAFSWYLDIVADNWDVLVLDDYKAVMPIPWQKKYFLKYSSQPFFCQQLGVFSKDEISKEQQQNFIKRIPIKFLKVSLNLNSAMLFDKNMVKKTNYILKLNDSHSNLFKSFSKGRKHAAKVGEKNELKLKETSIESLIKIQEEFYTYTNYSKEKLEILSAYILKNNLGFIQGVFKDNVLIGGAFFLKTNNNIIYLFSSFSSLGKKMQAASFLINTIIKQHENTNNILDFEGGNMPNIGSFYKSFGAKITSFYFFKRSFL